MEKFIKECFKLAIKGKNLVAPNPMVGAVLVNQNDEIVANGAHLKCGEAHAEVNCINDFILRGGQNFSELTMYVNLEPCAHYGKTPPCTDLIIEKGVKRVVIAMLDPNPKVCGNGVMALQDAGVEVEIGVLEDEAAEFNKIFIKNVTTKKPYVAIKTATTLDGKIATLSGSSKWITSLKSRLYVKKLRSEFDALLSGSGTVLADNPSFLPAKNVFIIDREKKLSSNPNFNIINDFKDFDTFFKELYKIGIYSVLVEGGSGLNSAIIKAGEADFFYQFIAPKILGKGLGFADGLLPDSVDSAIVLKNIKMRNFSPDVLLTAEFRYN